MKIFHLGGRGGSTDLDPTLPGTPINSGDLSSPTVTTGVFDGVHRGHAKIITELTRWAHSKPGSDAVILTFDRHPRVVLRNEKTHLITSLAHRLRLFARLGVDAVVVVHFDHDFAALSAEDFVRQVLVDQLGAQRILLGEDHRFGHGRRGDLALLEKLGPTLGFEARAVHLEELGDDLVISSTEVRKAISEGQLEAARGMLDRRVSVIGEVVTGDGRGRTLGFPTANLDLHHEARPPRGVYLGTATQLGALGAEDPPTTGLQLALVNIGRRPTFHPEANVDLVEAHLLDFDDDLVGTTLEVTFLKRLRDEQRFDGPEALKAQIARDREQGLAVARTLGLHPSPVA